MIKKLGLWLILISILGLAIMWFRLHQTAPPKPLKQSTSLLLPGQQNLKSAQKVKIEAKKFPKLSGKNVLQDEQTMLLGNEAANTNQQ